MLAFGAHPDDVELSASGTLLKQKSLGNKIGIIDLTRGELGTRGSAETRTQEALDSSQILGLDVRENLELADGFFEENQESLLKIISVIRKYQPDIVLANALSDRHPDHARAAKLVSRACFLSGLVKIESIESGISQLPWRPRKVVHYVQDNFTKPDFVVDITDYQETKMQSIAAFKTQFYVPDATGPITPISSKEFWDLLYGKALLFGRYIGCKYGEGFQSETPIESKDLMAI